MYNISNMRNEQQLGKWNFRMVSACQSFLLWSCELSYLWLSNQSLSSEQMWVIRYQPQTSFPDGNISSFVLRTIYPFPHKLGYAQEQYEQREQNQNICPIRFKGVDFVLWLNQRATNLVLFREFNLHLITYLSKIQH